jgi:hypothetical protein
MSDEDTESTTDAAGGTPAFDLPSDVDVGALPEDDAPPQLTDFLRLQIERAKTEALKAILQEELYFADPLTKAERDKADHAYLDAAKSETGSLWVKYKAADDGFMHIANDLVRKDSTTRKSPLANWIGTYLGGDAELKKLFDDQIAVEQQLLSRQGARDARARAAEANAKQIETRYRIWKTPGQNAETVIGSYAANLARLRCEIHEGNDFGVYQFWFEIAPKHLGLRAAEIAEANAPGITQLVAALAPYPARRYALKSGAQRKDASLYLIDPGTITLQAHRQAVLALWKTAVAAQAELQTIAKQNPDDSASLQKTLDGLRSREADAKKLFPAASV